MATCRCRLLGLLTAIAAIAPLGCAQSGPLTSRNTTLGSLKASVSQLEFDNEKLRKEIAELKSDNSQLARELNQEQEANGEITARLDDAKNLLRRQGGDVQALGIPSKTFEDDGIPPPTRRAKSRKPPAANLPRARPEPFDSPGDRGFDSTSNESSRDLGPISRVDDDRWLPVNRGMGSAIRR